MIAIDKETIGKVKDLKEKDYVYVFNNEPLDELLKLNIHCIHIDYVETLKDVEYAFRVDHKFAIIVPNFNNDHRRI